jgi:diketogulonate reductase-like aldo/keto reductase
LSGLPRSSYQICLSIHEGVGVDTATIEKHSVSAAKVLGIDYIDLVIVGGINPDVSIKNVSNGLLNLKKIGLAKDVGVGNYRLEELKIMEEYCEGQLVYNELQYSLVVREVTKKNILEYMNAKNIVLGAYRPLHLGQLAKNGISVLDNLSNKYARTPAEISLKWLVSQEGVVTFPKASSREHIDAIASLYDWNMSEEDQSILTDNFPITVRNGDCIPPVYKFTT